MNEEDMKFDILVSFIMPVYNNEKYTPYAIESIMKQNNPKIELIVIDDGSTDKTSIILDEISMKYKNMYVFHQENQWIYASMNNGIRKANGQYIYIVNSDDKIEENTIEILLRNIIKYNYPDVLYTKVKIIHCNENQEEISPSIDTMPGITEDYFFSSKKEYRDNYFFLLKNGAFECEKQVIKREIALRHPFFNDWYASDKLFNTQVADEINTAVVLSDSLYLFHLYDDIKMNASKGKYYEYESLMRDEIFVKRYKTFEKWNHAEENIIKYLIFDRIKWMSRELNLISQLTYLSISEKIERIMNVSGSITNRFEIFMPHKEEIEARCFSALFYLFIIEVPDKNDDYYFAYEMVNSFLKLDKSDEDYKNINLCVNNRNNIYNLGLILYQIVSSNKANNVSIESVKTICEQYGIKIKNCLNGLLEIETGNDKEYAFLIGRGKEQVRIMARIKGYTFLKLSDYGEIVEIRYSKIHSQIAKCFGFDNLEELKELIQKIRL